jgi:glycosyltransferase involved in cell wall biosynthesis
MQMLKWLSFSTCISSLDDHNKRKLIRTVNLLLTITAYPPSVGGAQIHTHRLLQALLPQHRVQVISHWNSNRTDWLTGTTLNAPEVANNYIVDGIPVHQIGITSSEKVKIFPWTLLYYPLMAAALPALAENLGHHIDPYCSEIDLIHNVRIGREPISFASFLAAHKHDIPFIFTPLHHPRWSGWLHRYYIHLYRQADAVVALTEAEKRSLITLGVKENHISVTGIGPILADHADGNRFRRQYSVDRQPVVLFLGQKYLYKGIDVLLRAAASVWQKIPETIFVFIGPRTSDSQKLFSTVKDARVIELDSVDLQAKTDALAACSLLCVPSSQESFGGVYTEAWSLGKPVIVVNIPALSEVIANGVDGFLVRQDVREVAQAILDLLLNPLLAQQFGESGKKKVEEKFTWEKLARLTGEIYNRTMTGS